MHRSLAYAVQQIIAQELEVERLKHASILAGFDGVGSKNTTNSEKQKVSEITEIVQNKSSNLAKNTKQPGKNLTSLKEIVSLQRFSFYHQSHYI